MQLIRFAKLVCLISSFTLVVMTRWQAHPVSAFSAGPDPGRTGAPGELTCATGECHGNRRTIDIQHFRVIAPAAYQPGQTYPITIQHLGVDATRARWGFQITGLASSNGQQAGTWQSTDATTQIVEENILQRQYAQHTLAGSFVGQSGGASWTVNWTAPATNVGSVTFYAAGNQADNNNGSSGDQIFLTQLTIPHSLVTPTPTPTPTPTMQALPLSPSTGTLLFFNMFSSDASNRSTQNTRVSLTNTNETQSVTVRLMLVNGLTREVANYFLRLTAQQTASWLASDLDPGTTGFLYALAVDDVSGCPRSFNHLIGDESVKLSSGHAASFSAEAFTMHSTATLACESNTMTLRFDGVQFSHAPRSLALNSIGSKTDGNNTLLVLNHFGGDLSDSTGSNGGLGDLAGLLFDQAGNSFSFRQAVTRCQLIAQVNDDFPATAKPFAEIIPTQGTGWIKLWEANSNALLGASLNLQSRTNNQRNANAEGHLLHKLTLAESARLHLPLLAPQ